MLSFPRVHPVGGVVGRAGTEMFNCHINNTKGVHTMKHITKKIAAILLSGMVLLCAGCRDTSEKGPAVSADSLIKNPENSVQSETSSAQNAESSENETSSEPVESAESTQSSGAQNEPHFSFSHDPSLQNPSGAGVRICTLSEALANFNEISHKTAEGSPEEIIKTLLERNILCFAAMQQKCWTYGEATGWDPLVVPLYSNYIKSVDQMTDLFYGTYTENQAWRLFHPQDIDRYGNLCYADVFQVDEDGVLCFDLDHLRTRNGSSFETETYAAVIEASDDEITFGRYYESDPAPGSTQPNNMLFRAVKEYGEWRLNTYITDAPSFTPLYSSLVPTGRVGAPELMELAKEQVGNIGGEKYWGWYGFPYHIEWCGAFVSWCYAQAGKDGPYFTACNSEGAAWFKSHDQWGERGYPDIAPGDSIFFDWDQEGSADHVGLVLGTDGVYVYTIEGNRDDICIVKAYDLYSPYILGYGLMEWD